MMCGAPTCQGDAYGTAQRTCACLTMRALSGLIAYTAVVCLLAGGVILGARWLMEVAPTLKREVRAAPIPPRIADSIERKKGLPIQAAAPTPTPVRPVMQKILCIVDELTNIQSSRTPPPPEDESQAAA